MERKFLRVNCINSLIENFKKDCPSLIITSSKKLHIPLSHYFKNIFTIEDYFSENNTFDTDTDFTFVFEGHDNISLHLDVLLNLKSVTLYHLENSPFPSYSNYITTIPKSYTPFDIYSRITRTYSLQYGQTGRQTTLEHALLEQYSYYLQ